MSISEKNTRTQITLPRELKAELEAYAREDGRSFNNFVVNILTRTCRDMKKKQTEPSK